MNPKISIIMPAFNAERFLSETLQSVLKQTYTNWELIVVCDVKSRDETKALAERFAHADSRMKILIGPGSGGVTENRNLGITQVTGEYIAFLDADDLWLPEKLERQLKFALQSNAAFSYTGYRHINESGDDLTHIVRPPEKLSYKDLLVNNQIGCLTVLVSRKMIGQHRFKTIGHEDLALWIEILKTEGIVARGLPEVLAKYRIVKGSRSDNKLRAARMRWENLRVTADLNFFAAASYFVRYAVTGFAKHKRIK